MIRLPKGKEKKKSRIRERLNLLTDADSITIAMKRKNLMRGSKKKYKKNRRRRRNFFFGTKFFWRSLNIVFVRGSKKKLVVSKKIFLGYPKTIVGPKKFQRD